MDDGREELGDTTCDYGGDGEKDGRRGFGCKLFTRSCPFFKFQHTSRLVFLVTFDKKKTFSTIWWNVIIFSYLTDWKRVVSLFFSKEKEREKKISDALVCERADEENIT